MPRVFNLAPPAPGSKGVAEPEKAGAWIALPFTLPELAERVSAASGEIDALKAVPDPWAYPRTFADALLAIKHPLKDRFVGEWRGLLALFAFAREFDDRYHLGFSTVTLDRPDSFDTVFRELRPALSLRPEWADLWREPVVLWLNVGAAGDPDASTERHPIGLLNPACLVTTGWSSQDVRLASIPWMRNGLSDPLKLTGDDTLSRLQMRTLSVYLHELLMQLDGLLGEQPKERSNWAAIRAQLLAFHSACEALAVARGYVVDPRAGEGPPAGDLYEALWQPILLDPLDSSQCLATVRSIEGKELPFKGIILADPALVATFNRPAPGAGARDGQRWRAQDVHVWGNHTLRDLAQSPDLFQKIRDEAERAGYLLLRPDDFFADCLAELKEAAIPRHGPLCSAALPLSPLALFVCPPADFAARVRRDGNRIAFELEVDGKPHTIAKEFIGADRVSGTSWSVAHNVVWPDFATNSWSHYHSKLMYAEMQAKALRPQFATSASALAEMFRDVGAEHLRRWAADAKGEAPGAPLPRFDGSEQPVIDTPSLRRVGYSESGSRIALQASPVPFEAMLCEVIPEPGANPRDAGLILLPAPTPAAKPSSTETAIVSIDFGTTATVAFVKRGEEEHGSKVQFQDRVLKPIASTGARAQSFQTAFIDFLPAELQVPPISTAWFPQDLGEGLPDSAVLNGVILFQPENGVTNQSTPPQIEAWASTVAKAAFDLKWDGQLHEERRRFLRQFVIMVAAELVASGIRLDRVVWRFSYPQALRRAQRGGHGQDQVGAFSRMIESVLREVLGSSYAKNNFSLHLESEAAAKFIVEQGGEQGGPFGDYSVVLDIGGGTTDALICEGRDAIWSGSYKLAGMDYFTRSLLDNPKLLQGLGLASWATALEKTSKKEFALELLFGGTLLDVALKDKWTPLVSQEKAAVTRLLGSTYIYLGGLAYYLGLVARKVVHDAKGEPQSVGFGLCGRGARFPIMVMGDRPESSHVARALELFTVSARPLKFTTPLRIKRSAQAKLEVVQGMLIDSRLEIDADKLASSRSPHGLGVTATSNGKSQPIAATSAPEESRDKGSLEISDPGPFMNFLSLLETHVGVRVGDHAYIEEYVRKNALSDPAEMENQPAFILALRWLVRAVASGREGSGQAVGKIRVEIKG